ncbi:putative phosphoglycerate mutase [Flavobacterium sp. 9]|uniref:histidine phosphatase family protein n=1 Tax=Flavobacterium sp. 9 TaxID=2035198 RepID=UPI000C174820|nr:histidine phosphatase family protein [Flavobacterium sp. 9]PIF29995.1 putative phosphoglycerate mutase [Flavobacterium sp. 9]
MKTYKIFLLAVFLFGITSTITAQKSKTTAKSKTVTFYIARHGKTMLNTLDRVQGWSDAPLTPEGIQVAEFLGKGLKGIDFKAAYTSDLGRATQTTNIVLKAKGDKKIPITETEGLRETNFGSYEADLNSKMWGDIAIYLHFKTTEDLFADVKVNGVNEPLKVVKILDKLNMAEDYEQVRTRTQNALRNIAEKEAATGGGNIFIVGHGMAIGTMLSNISGEEVARSHMANASVCKVIYENGKFTVESFGDTSYIEKGKKEL